MKELSTNNIQSSIINAEHKRSADAWGTMQEIKPKLYSEKGTVEGVEDLSVADNTFEFTLDSVNNTAVLSILIMNTGEENSILEYSMFSENKPSGVYFINNHRNINAANSQTAKIEINCDYISTGDTTFQVTLNSNSQTGETYHTYNITIHKEYDLVYQEWYTGEEEVKTVLQKSQFMTRYTYTGREYNRETGQYYYRARTYASGLGRFTGKDPVGYPGYEYVKNNPIILRDCSGKAIPPELLPIIAGILLVGYFAHKLLKYGHQYGMEVIACRNAKDTLASLMQSKIVERMTLRKTLSENIYDKEFCAELYDYGLDTQIYKRVQKYCGGDLSARRILYYIHVSVTEGMCAIHNIY